MNNLLQHLKDMNHPIMEGFLVQTENMLARGRMDLPLNLCFATLRGDDIMLHQLLKKGLDTNESDNNGRTPLTQKEVWGAMLGGHDKMAKLLKENWENIDAGDVGHFACTAAEQNDFKLLKEIVRYGGDVTRPRYNGYKALHVAVFEGNIEIVKFLLERSADIDKADVHGWNPRDLAEQQGHEEMKMIFESSSGEKMKTQSIMSILEKQETRYLGRFTSEPVIRTADGTGGSWRSRSQSRPKRRTNNLHNSLFGILSAAQNVEKDLLLSVHQSKGVKDCCVVNSARVIISCPEKGATNGMLVLLPGSLRELVDIGAKKFGISAAKMVNKGAEIDNIEVIRDGDHLAFVSDGQWQQQIDNQTPQCNGNGLS